MVVLRIRWAAGRRQQDNGSRTTAVGQRRQDNGSGAKVASEGGGRKAARQGRKNRGGETVGQG